MRNALNSKEDQIAELSFEKEELHASLSDAEEKLKLIEEKLNEKDAEIAVWIWFKKHFRDFFHAFLKNFQELERIFYIAKTEGKTLKKSLEQEVNEKNVKIVHLTDEYKTLEQRYANRFFDISTEFL